MSQKKIPHFGIFLAGMVWLFFGLFGTSLVESSTDFSGLAAFVLGLVVMPLLFAAVAAAAYTLGLVIWMIYEALAPRIEVEL